MCSLRSTGNSPKRRRTDLLEVTGTTIENPPANNTVRLLSICLPFYHSLFLGVVTLFWIEIS